MEHAPQSHHREGIQNELDKAYDEAHRDNEVFDEAQAKISETKAEEIVHKEYGDIGDKEAHGKPSQERTLSFLRDAGYLDTSFEGKETHTLTIRPLTKEEALAEYKTSGGKTSVWDELEKNMVYTIPRAENLDVMIMNFDRGIESDEALVDMDKFGVRPLTYEELIQYGIAHPSHQKQKRLVGLGTKQSFGGSPRTPILWFGDGVRGMSAVYWDDVCDIEPHFPVVRK